MLGEEAFGGCVEFEAILGFGEAVSFIRKEHIVMIDAFFDQGSYNLLGLGLLDAWIVGTLRDEQGDPLFLVRAR